MPGPPSAKISLQVSNSLCTARGIDTSFFCRRFLDDDLPFSVANSILTSRSAKVASTLIQRKTHTQKKEKERQSSKSGIVDPPKPQSQSKLQLSRSYGMLDRENTKNVEKIGFLASISRKVAGLQGGERNKERKVPAEGKIGWWFLYTYMAAVLARKSMSLCFLKKSRNLCSECPFFKEGKGRLRSGWRLGRFLLAEGDGDDV